MRITLDSACAPADNVNRLSRVACHVQVAQNAEDISHARFANGNHCVWVRAGFASKWPLPKTGRRKVETYMRNFRPVLLRRDGRITDLLLPPGQGVASIAAGDADRS
jgi:hypothetical protein